ncbi:hypothetical protein GlitD10_2213, partial [Gloeomargarita lithophora Alchichica-D10]
MSFDAIGGFVKAISLGL